jgi:uncharacterized protein YkwD
LKRTLCLAFALLVLAACGKPPEKPAPEPAPAPESGFATPAPPPEPLPPVATAPEVSELPPPPAEPAETLPEPVSADEEPAADNVAAEDGLGIPISESPEEEPPVSEHPKELDTAQIELELLRLINGLRTELGTEPLGLQEAMLYAARVRSLEALEQFTHTRPDGTPYNTAFDEAGFSYAGKWHGENLASLSFAEGQLDEAEAALKLFEGLNASPGHRENMARGNFAQAGIGVAASMENETVTLASAQLFASF